MKGAGEEQSLIITTERNGFPIHVYINRKSTNLWPDCMQLCLYIYGEQDLKAKAWIMNIGTEAYKETILVKVKIKFKKLERGKASHR